MDYRELHRDALVIDLHNDAIVNHIRHGNRSFEPGSSHDGVSRRDGTISWLRGPLPLPAGRTWEQHVQVNFPKLRAGGIDAGIFAIDVTLAFQNHLAYAMDGFGFFFDDLERSGSAATIVRSTDELLRARAEGKVAALLAVEHADGTERSLNVLRSLYQLGVRSVGLTHNVSSWAADGCFEARPGVGLTQYGAELVREMNRLGMLVDLAHVSESAFFSALEVSTKPIAFTHGCARALCDHPRNLTDDQLRALAKNGGVIGLTYVPVFVDPTAPTFERLIDHLDHIVDAAGVDAAAIGSDFDGGGTMLADATETPLVTRALLERGYAEEDVRKILGLNALRVLRATIG